MLRFACPSCERVMSAPEHTAGKPFRCPVCRTLFRLSDEFTAAPPEDEPPLVEAVPNRRPAHREPPVPDASPPHIAGGEIIEGVLEDDDEDDYDRRDRRPRRRRRRRRRYQGSGGGVFSWFNNWDPTILTLLIICAVWTFMCLFSMVVRPATIGLIVVGIGLMIGGEIWFLVLAFRNDVSTGLLVMFIPFYGLYFLLSNLDECWPTVAVSMIGSFMLINGLMLLP